jgi:hypothetical protein
MLKIIIHLSGRNAEVFGYTSHEKEPNSEIIVGISRLIFLDLDIPIIPVGIKIPLITRNNIRRFKSLYDCSTVPPWGSNIMLLLRISKLLNSAVAKIMLVTMDSNANILFLFIIEYTMKAEDRRKPIILSESTAIILRGKIINKLFLDIV